MIDEIHICDVALIHDAHFEPDPSLTVITGETGAGKTALLNAIKLLVGERSDASLVREGSDELKVEGRFFLNADEAFDGSFSTGGKEVVVSRRVNAQGRSRVSINGSLASVKELAACVGHSVDLCGQHEHQHLLSAAYQRSLLDAWAGDEVASALVEYQNCFRAVEAYKKELQRLRDLESADSVELDRARFALEQIDDIDPQPSEYDDLLEQLPRLENAEMLMSESMSAQNALRDSHGVLEQIEGILTSLERMSKVDASINEDVNAVRDAYFSLEEVCRALATYRDGIEFSGNELEAAQERLSALQGLMRGFGPRMEDVFERRRQAQEKLSEYEGRDELISQAEHNLSVAEGDLVNAADNLRKARERALPRFLEAVEHQLARLEMGSARLEATLVDLPREEWDTWGPHTCELMYAAGAHLKPQRLAKVASGGEMSRIMLALKVVLGTCDNVDTLVFDEIDAGVGGQTARSLAEVLLDLARSHQVIVVTHLPQVAVCGKAHYVVRKTAGETPETQLYQLSPDERVDEIARMLAGEVNEVSRTHAKELLEEREGDNAD